MDVSWGTMNTGSTKTAVLMCWNSFALDSAFHTCYTAELQLTASTETAHTTSITFTENPEEELKTPFEPVKG